MLTDLATQTLDIAEAKAWLLETQISDYRLGPTFAGDVRGWLADMPHRELARRLSGGLTGEIPAAIKNMVVDTYTANDFIEAAAKPFIYSDTSCFGFITACPLTRWPNRPGSAKPTTCGQYIAGTKHIRRREFISISVMKILITTTPL